jgi:uncharacterized protein YjbI with pentapeptide repeats
VLAIAWVLIVPAADWLARHDVGSAKGTLLQTARDAARGRLLTLGAGLFAAAALIFTALNFNLLRRSSEQADRWQRRTYELTEQGQVTDRYTKAVEQLGSDNKLDVRIGGIYALERVAHDSPRDHPTVMEVLAAFVREHSREPWPLPADDEPGIDPPERMTRPDVQAAATVIGRRETAHDRRPVNLGAATLVGADLTSANLTQANLTRADLTGADLTGADLTGADLTGAKLTRAKLVGAKLTGAKLTGAKLTRARLTGADLAGANLTHATVTRANLTRADLTRADLTRADLTGTDLTGTILTSAVLTRANLTQADLNAPDLTGAVLTRAVLTRAALTGADLTSMNLTGADLTAAILTRVNLTGADLTGADLTGALTEPDAAIPVDWQRNTDSGRLERGDTSSGGPTTN